MEIRGVSPQPNSWVATKGPLSTEALDLIKNAMGIKGGIKILSVEQGIKGIEGLNVLKEIKSDIAKPIYQNIANILNLEQNDIQSILVIIGGAIFAKEEIDRLKKTVKKIQAQDAQSLAQDLGIELQDDVLIYASSDGINFESGGLILIQSALKEIGESIQEEH